MKRHILTILAVAGLVSVSSYAQDTWSLEQCIEYALDQSLLIERAVVNQEMADVNVKQTKQARWPNLNFQASGGVNIGRVINPSTNQFGTDDSYYQSYGIGSGVTLFGGNRINNMIKQADIEYRASTFELEQTRVNLARDVALAYLNVLFAKENVTTALTTRELSESQLEQMEKLIAAGSRPENERYDIVAQIALDQQNLVQRENEVEQSLLVLKQLMRLEANAPLELDSPELEEELLTRIDSYSFDGVYEAALQTQPQIRAQQLRIESAEYGEKIAKASTVPTVGFNANAVSNWSDLAKEVTASQTVRQPIDGLYLNGMELPLEQEIDMPTEYSTIPYFEQINDNFGFGAGIDLRVPLYNNYQNKANIERAKLNTILERNTDEQIKQNLKTDIQNALASAEAAREALNASQSALDAAEIAYDNSQRRFDLGTLNSYDFINARNRLTSAQINFTISKYDYVFRLIVIEFYLGRGVKYE